jgi:hypothetical protein
MSGRGAALATAAATFGAALSLAAAAPRRATQTPRPQAPAAAARPADADTKCGACHVASSWSTVRFAHDRTGFSLVGAHARTACRDCHPRDFTARVADTCAGCHRDRHAGEFGLHCEGCHDENDWRNTRFGPEAHRSTAFPLTGKHATIPCRECHGDLRDMTFTRAPLACVACHRADYDGARLQSIDHAAAGFGTDCQSCHTTWRFSPARFDAHDLCFIISAGPHRGIACGQCHTQVAGLAQTGTCNTGNARCTSCHAHTCAKSDSEHQGVMGYVCTDRKCPECHMKGVR